MPQRTRSARPWPRVGWRAAGRELDRLVALFGRDSVVVELTHHGYPEDDERNDALAELAATVPAADGGHRQRALRPTRRVPAGHGGGGGAGATVDG